MLLRKARRAALAVAVAALAGAAAPGAAHAQLDLAACPSGINYDQSIPTWEQHFAERPNKDAVVPLGRGTGGSGGGAPQFGSGASDTQLPQGRNLTSVIYDYWDRLVEATANNPRVRVIKKFVGKTASGQRDIYFYVLGTPEHIANLDAPDGDAAFWRSVRAGTVPEEVGLEAAVNKPAFAWITATPHGGESAAAESITRQAYELVSRTDCENLQRLKSLTFFLQPVRNPDGRDAIQRYTSWGFDPNRDFGTGNQVENGVFVPLMNQYPGVFFIDAHQTTNDYFFPPNEDPVHHEISHFALNFIQNRIGPALQDAFNAQSIAYRNYSQYDLFTPEYGDTVPSLIMGAAGMTYEKGTREAYQKQVYDHYLAIDTTIKATVEDKVGVTTGWVKQWSEAVQQGQNCQMQPNSLVSPLHDTIKQQPDTVETAGSGNAYTVCGYFFKPDQHTGDTVALIEHLQKTGVRVYKLDTPVAVNGYHEYGTGNVLKPGQVEPLGTSKPVTVDGVTLPAGTLYIPMNQGMKHWIQALLGENPFIPYDYYYDVVSWSYPLQRGLAGSGFLTQNIAPGVAMTEVTPGSLNYGTVTNAGSPVYAFNTDSARGLALAIELLDKNVNVYRATQSFVAGGKTFFSGAALVDAGSLTAGGVDVASLASARDTPVIGLPNYPVSRKQLAKPKIGLYTGGTTVPSNPLFPGTPPGTRYCGQNSFCEALHDLGIKLGLPTRVIVPVTSTDLTNNVLSTGGFTAFINQGSAIAVSTGTEPNQTLTTIGQNLQNWVNAGGTYIGVNNNGTNVARQIRTTTLEAETTTTLPDLSRLLTPGSTFDGTYDVTNPVAWGFDLGGWIYRDNSGNSVFRSSTVGTTASTVVRYKPTPDEKYGYENLANILDDRPAVVDSPAGQGRAVLFGFNPFFRSWKEQDERLLLNAALYPKGAALAAEAASETTAQPAPVLTEIKAAAVAPKAKGVGTAIKGKTVSDRDVKIQVKRKDSAKLKLAVKRTRLSKAIRKKISYRTTKTTVTLVIKGVRTSNEHAREQWVGELRNQIQRRKVTPIYALL
ncbi:zinc carboxypeptidase [Solirubrobacter pauli]|uniref:Zinc carboxypeptidase n=1 Tax=Solirubrobacter pauli TaxID=166793 RepID=A0A660L7Z4_9ACTN|nr:M14 family zinc carboxypeptidase [Solirubrobacter pauli]RKQ90486.1 zinc carboxypeptidase [Solirubrobacter pauli]